MIICSSEAIDSLKVDSVEFSQYKFINEDTVVILDKYTDKLETYKIVYKLLRSNVRLSIVDTGASEEIYRFIAIFMVTNGNYNIYKTSLELIDDEYINTLSHLENTVKDISNYIDSNVEEYDFILEVLNKVISASDEDIPNIVKENMNIISKSLDLIQLLKLYLEDNLIESMINQKENEIEELKNTIANMELELSSLKTDKANLIDEKESEIKKLRDEILQLEAVNSNLEDAKRNEIDSLVWNNDTLISDKEEEIQRLTNDIDKLTQDNKNLESSKNKEIEELSNKIAEIINNNDTTNETIICNQENEKVIEELNSKIINLEEEKKVLEEASRLRIESLEKLNNELNGKIKEMESLSSEHKSRIDELQEELAHHIEESEIKYTIAINELEKAKSTNQDIKNKEELLNDKNREIELLKEQLNNKSTNEEVERLNAELEKYQAMEKELEDSKIYAQELENKIGNNSELLKAKEEIEQLKEELFSLEPKAEDLTQVDRLNNELDKLREQYEELFAQNESLISSKSEIQSTLDTKDIELKSLKIQVEKLSTANEELISKLNDRAPTIQAFRPILLQTIMNRTKHILYIKEISTIPYINSLIVNMMQILNGAEIDKVKLVIYDNKNDFNIMYKGINTVTGPEYAAKKDIIINKCDRLAVLDYSTHILEDILKQENDLVIVYDRLKCLKDLVQGSGVTKYYVFNSRSHIDNTIRALGEDIPPENIITRSGVMINSIAPVKIKGYSSNTKSAKISSWSQMRSCNIVDKDQWAKSSPIILNILKSAGVDISIGR